MKVDKSIAKKVLEKLYEDYFPSHCFSDELSKAVGMGKGDKPALGVEAVLAYLKGKGLAEETDDGWGITAKGIDFLEGKNLIQLVSPRNIPSAILREVLRECLKNK